MHDAIRTLDARGGLIATHELIEAGFGRRARRQLLDDGVLWRIRQGWFARPDTDPMALRAVRVGGVLTCGHALRRHGLWALEHPEVHVRVAGTDSRLREDRDSRRRRTPASSAVVHWTGRSAETERLVATVSDALSDYRRCVPHDWYLAALDSALHHAPLERDALRRAGHPVGVDGIDGVCESGTETMFWLAIRELLPSIRRQQRIPGVGRVDFLIGERLVVEIDSREFHDTAPGRAADRRRDLDLSLAGYRCLRFDYDQIVNHLDRVVAAVLAAVSRGDHLR
ncbi:DUF559 domain-containing protein [Microcella flavibacter]|uniref:DUF559 domain-containing protein n=1 Tax=Microcella flavibacter TaxID=1804990 RepID=UPI0014575F90|nr:DUF559 domain-containing protein [Microcella flavibacter]